MFGHADTIVALSTPPGRGGIGIVRLSGPDALRILRAVVALDSFQPSPNVMQLKPVMDPATGNQLDEALVCFFKAPNSFTGEDVVEFHCHGSPVLLRRLIDITLSLDARLAQPGEFSLRAVTHGRLQLIQAEAIRDLIDSQTQAAANQAMRQLKGETSYLLQGAKDELVKIIIRLESSLEFVEDDLPELECDQLVASVSALKSKLAALADTFGSGKLLRDGIKVALIGRPNVGKSSLFNSLLGQGRAIVTDIPGTTRDTLTEWTEINGTPVLLVDTAGLRTAFDTIESIGVERARRAAADADLLLVVLDGSESLRDDDYAILGDVEKNRYVIAANKCDLATFSKPQPRNGNANALVVSVSATDHTGLDSLRAALLEPFKNGAIESSGLLITNARHHDLLQRSIAALHSSLDLLESRASEELILVGLHNALLSLGEITGETTTEDLLGRIFSTFCIGK